jgi:meromycolic acid enoyl-[acyl-carrier-protein] reductase
LILAGKRILVTGVLTKHSIAFAVAAAALEQGAEVLLTSCGRARSLTERSARQLAGSPEVLELDVARFDDFSRLRGEIEERWSSLDGVLHAIAYAPPEALNAFSEASEESILETLRVSVLSYRTLAATLAPLMAPSGSVVGLDFDASRAWPGYDWMGVAKAALESANRYLARELGRQGARSNLIAAGPLRTPSGSFEGFAETARAWDAAAPLGWDPTDAEPIAGTACFLFSDLSNALTGEVIHVDGGFHAIGMAEPLPQTRHRFDLPDAS